MSGDAGLYRQLENLCEVFLLSRNSAANQSTLVLFGNGDNRYLFVDLRFLSVSTNFIG